MCIGKKATLHVVHLETNCNAAAFFENHIVEGVWDDFVTCWAASYIGFPKKMKVDQGSALTSVRWTHRADAVGTVVQTSVAESHNSLEWGERYHAPMWCVFNKIILKDPKIKRKIAPKLAVKATKAENDGIRNPLKYFYYWGSPSFR